MRVNRWGWNREKTYVKERAQDEYYECDEQHFGDYNVAEAEEGKGEPPYTRGGVAAGVHGAVEENVGGDEPDEAIEGLEGSASLGVLAWAKMGGRAHLEYHRSSC